MENGNKPRFLTKCNDNDSLFEITDDEAINDKIFGRMKRRKNYKKTKQQKQALSNVETEVAMRLMAEKDPNFLKKLAARRKLDYHPVEPMNTAKNKTPTPKKTTILKNKQSQHHKFKQFVIPKQNDFMKVGESQISIPTLQILDPSQQ